jgi:hypothetical protein
MEMIELKEKDIPVDFKNSSKKHKGVLLVFLSGDSDLEIKNKKKVVEDFIRMVIDMSSFKQGSAKAAIEDVAASIL